MGKKSSKKKMIGSPYGQGGFQKSPGSQSWRRNSPAGTPRYQRTVGLNKASTKSPGKAVITPHAASPGAIATLQDHKVSFRDDSQGNADDTHPLTDLHLKPVGRAADLMTKVIVVEGPAKTAWRRLPRGTHSRNKKLSAKERRSLGIGRFPKGEQRFDLFLPLYDLWRQYITELLSLKSSRFPHVLESKLQKADYHGCLVTVAKSRCPSYVGTTGIILQELQNVFKIVTRADCVKVIPKAHTVFTFELGGFHMTLYGNQLGSRASERSAKKFKSKPTIDL
eukprot:scpid64303/ scgid7111/ Ribonuclease P protein subunit p29